MVLIKNYVRSYFDLQGSFSIYVCEWKLFAANFITDRRKPTYVRPILGWFPFIPSFKSKK